MINVLNNPFNLIWICLGLHVFSDFVLQIQGELHKLKQCSWWNKELEDQVARFEKIKDDISTGINEISDNDTRISVAKKYAEFVSMTDTAVSITKSKYSKDYIAAMLCHCVLWAVVTFLPLMFLGVNVHWFSVAMLANIVFHAVVDHLKANKMCINLCADQIFHLIQIVATVLIFVH